MEKIKYTLNWNGNYGYIEYDEATKKATIVMKDAPEIIKVVEDFLNKELTLDVPESDNVRDFTTKTLYPLENKDNLRLCLTRLWSNTGVLVEWSMPPEIIDKL
ncbi:MAG TPA: hypothetical protein IAB06_04965 [Candidatus Avacidaminococcus intestinavium]|uniref:Uncharacterized protein n=1 Tax=Candidatus Avacidaminococcus intestinavium TaxID=2840684 RepID=A0A9D1MQE7_9FIRM|nr:hypothetical protein [Candidatus Avacidaminococcus intestinavium]